MLNANYSIVAKGEYDNGKSIPKVYPKQYIILKNKKEKFLSLRFFNGLEDAITRIEFILFQIDTAGNVIKSSRIIADDIKASPGRTVALNEGVKLSEKCVDFKIQMIEARCGKYAYSLVHKDALPIYKIGIRWKYDYEGQLNVGYFSAKSKMKADYPLIKFLAALAILSAVFAGFFPIIESWL